MATVRIARHLWESSNSHYWSCEQNPKIRLLSPMLCPVNDTFLAFFAYIPWPNSQSANSVTSGYFSFSQSESLKFNMWKSYQNMLTVTSSKVYNKFKYFLQYSHFHVHTQKISWNIKGRNMLTRTSRQIQHGGPMLNQQNTSRWPRSDKYNIRNTNRALLALPITLARPIIPQQTFTTSIRRTKIHGATTQYTTLSGRDFDQKWGLFPTCVKKRIR
jgi:hypothetical protein